MKEQRKDIQGLRALAVTVVVLYHLWPGRLPGGFVGVDVFFVISGFLITAHLLAEISRTGTVSVTRFWARRIRRLLPAAFVVLAASFLAALIILPKSLLVQTVTEIAASALYVLNWLLAANSTDYLAADNVASIVQHFWSLSVEEQFYLVWPVLLLVVAWLFRKRVTDDGRRRAIGWTLAAIFVLSLSASIITTSISQPTAFFVTYTRVWEFAAGGLILFIPRRLGLALLQGGRMNVLIDWVGFGLIASALILFNDDSAFPGWIALIPVLGTALLIITGESRSAWSPKFYGQFRPVQFVGDASYSIYLWHWPLLIVFPFVFLQEPSSLAKVGIIGVTVVLAALTKRFVEDPVRFAGGIVRRRIPTFAFMASGMALLVGLSIFTTYRVDEDNAQLASVLAADAVNGCVGASAVAPNNRCELPYAVTRTVDPGYAAEDFYWTHGAATRKDCTLSLGAQHCDIGKTDSNTLTVALIGDSHAEHIIDPLVTYGEAAGWRILTYTKACTSFEFVTATTATEDPESCETWSRNVFGEVRDNPDVDLVLYSLRPTIKSASPTDVLSVWTELADSGKQVVALRDVPGMQDGISAPVCVELAMDQYDPCAWSPPLKPDFVTSATELSKGNVPLIDLTPIFCTGGTCHAVIGGIIVYFDDNHLSYTFAQTLAPYLGSAIQAVVDEDPQSKR